MNNLSTSIHISDKIQIVGESINIKGELSEEEWFEALAYCSAVNNKIKWVIAELLIYGEKKKYRKYEDLLKKTNYDYGTLANIKYVAESVEVSRRRESLSFSHHQEVAKLPPDKQDFFLNKAVEEKLSTRDLREEIRKGEFVAKIQSLPAGEYSIIYADPPWQYDFSETDSRKIENQYPTMTVDEICSMPLPEIAEDALLLMWATSPKFIEALKVITAWGFTYKTNGIWDKGKIGMGYWFRGQHEHLLVATKGAFPPPMPEYRNSSIYKETRQEHSAKPDFYYEWIERSFTGNKIELFSRNKRTGWEAWGNE